MDFHVLLLAKQGVRISRGFGKYVAAISTKKEKKGGGDVRN